MRPATLGERIDLAVRADAVLPAVTRAVERHAPSASVRAVHATRVFPVAGQGFGIQYEVSPADGPPLAIGAFLPESGEWPAWAMDGGVERVSAIGLAILAYPHDPRLPQLAALHEREALRQWSFRCGIDAGSDPTPPRVLAYRVLRRAVLRTPSTGGSLVTKLLRPDRARAALRAHTHLAAAGGGAVRLPALRGWDEARGLIGMEFVEGRSPHDDLTGGDFAAACESAGSVLRDLHGVQPPEHVAHLASDEIAQLERWAALLLRTGWEDVGEMGDTLARLRERIPAGVSPSCVHRDFHDKQVLCSPAGAVLIDWDGMCAGDAAMDFGNYMAHLKLRGLQHPEAGREIERGARRFAEAYPMDFTRWAWWSAASLIRLAVVYRLRPRWKHLFMPLLAEAASMLCPVGARP